MSNTTGLNFRDATRQQAKASILLEGLTGTGKSGLALVLAKALADGDMQKVFAADTENKSLDLFEGIRFNTGDVCKAFKKVDLLSINGYSPSNYLYCKDMAVKSGAKVFINDSITHMWQREGGVLDIVEKVKQKNPNGYTAWGDDSVVKEKNGIYETVRDNRVHVISTVRVKEKFDVVYDTETGKTKPVSIGEQAIQMPDLKYEPDLVLYMEHPGNADGTPPIATVIKSRYVIFKEGESYKFTEDLIKGLVSYLKEGADPAELLERQKAEILKDAKEILDADASKRTMLPIILEQQHLKGKKLAELDLNSLRIIMGILLN